MLLSSDDGGDDDADYGRVTAAVEVIRSALIGNHQHPTQVSSIVAQRKKYVDQY